jgi:UMF1 family MFS transporter
MKKIWLWYLYDFANSFASVVLLLYYPLILSEKGASDSWIGVSASIATGILLFILPKLGAYSDRLGKKIPFIRTGSIIMVASLVCIAFITNDAESLSLPIILGLSLLYIIFQVFFQGSFSFYSAMLREITNSNDNTKVSGRGFGFGQLGNVLSIVIISLILTTKITILGLSDKSLAIFLGGIFFLLLSIPFFHQKYPTQNKLTESFSYKNFIRKITSDKKILFFLIGYSLLADALLTFQLYVALYVKNVFGFSDQYVIYAGVIGLFFSVVGGFIAHLLVNKLNNKNKALRISSVVYGLCFGITAIIPPVPILVFFVLALTGVSMGLLFSLARSIYSEISPRDNQGEFFGIYSVFEKAASIIGPLLWIGTFLLLENFGSNLQYRGSVLLLMLICFFGIFFLKKSESEQK